MQKDRVEMVRVIARKYKLNSPKVLSVMRIVPRHKFVPITQRVHAHEDHPVDIGYGQTMSQPCTVAFMTHLITDLIFTLKFNLKNNNTKVLEIGTGSGYQAAILSYFFNKVYSVEIVPKLAKSAKTKLRKLGYGNVFVKRGSGKLGWWEESPFDAIIVTAGVKEVPQELFVQLKTGGLLLAPVGKKREKTMTRYIKTSRDTFRIEKFGKFLFVPFVESKQFTVKDQN